MNSWRRLVICLAVVSVFYAFHVHLKTAKIFANPTWDAQDEVGQFWSEFAFQYRFAKFFATHPTSEWGQLKHDRDVQYPDTIDDWAEFTVVMEVPVGVLYRWWKPAMPLHVFVVWYDCLISSLSVFGVFFLARALWRSDKSGVFASALYVALYPSYGRTVKNLFLREDFAIPLIIFALCFTVRAVQDLKRRDQILAALFWLAALASWHLTQFVMAPLLLAAVLVYLGRGETPQIPWFVLTLAAGTVAVPVLRAKQVFFAPTMCGLYALALAVWINGGRKRAIIVFAGWAAVLLALSTLMQRSYGEYAHVYDLFLYKLRFLGQRPPDPARLPWEARLLWEGGAFNTADWGEFWRSLKWCGPLGLVAAMLLSSRKRGACATNIFIVFTLLLAPLAWMVLRNFTFLGFAAAVLTAGLVTRRIWWKLVVFAAAVWETGDAQHTATEAGASKPRRISARGDLVGGTHADQRRGAGVDRGFAGVPRAHGTPDHHALESSRTNGFATAITRCWTPIYGSEGRFYEFAHKYGADYFVYDVGFLYDGMESRRYKADKLGPLDPNCAAELFQNHPEQLKHFRFEMANGRFAVFRVLTSP